MQFAYSHSVNHLFIPWHGERKALLYQPVGSSRNMICVRHCLYSLDQVYSEVLYHTHKGENTSALSTHVCDYC